MSMRTKESADGRLSPSRTSCCAPFLRPLLSWVLFEVAGSPRLNKYTLASTVAFALFLYVHPVKTNLDILIRRRPLSRDNASLGSKFTCTEDLRHQLICILQLFAGCFWQEEYGPNHTAPSDRKEEPERALGLQRIFQHHARDSLHSQPGIYMH